MSKVERDGRKAEWAVEPRTVLDMARCFPGNRALFQTLDSNANTWRKISEGKGVTRHVAESLVRLFFDFLARYADGEIPKDRTIYRDRAIRKAIMHYLDGQIVEEDLLIDLTKPPPAKSEPRSVDHLQTVGRTQRRVRH